MSYNLEVMTRLMERLGNPQNTLKCVHVAGTNGKGSTIAFLSSIILASGKRVATYTSPALADFKENIRINNVQISEQDAVRLLGRVEAAAEGLDASQFEKETALAFLYFAASTPDIAIIECGMGGRYDATNVIENPLLAVLTSISLEHTETLGGTIEQIRSHKEGIIKNNCPVVDAARLNKITLIKSDLDGQVFDYGGLKGLTIHLAGQHQTQNAALAVSAAKILGIDDRFIYEGLKSAQNAGRLTVLNSNPLFIVDGAHNEAGAEALAASLRPLGKKIIFIAGIFRDKAAEKMIEAVAPLARQVILIDMPENKRLFRAGELKKIVIKYIDTVECAASPKDAVMRAFTAADRADIIVSFGSLSTINAVMSAVTEQTQQ